MHEVVVVGSGPTGYTAGIYLARARLSPVIVSGVEIGGQLMYTTVVENFPGFPDGIQGPDLMIAMRSQAERFGAQIVDKVVTAIEPIEGGYKVTAGTDVFETRSVVLAVGAKARTLNLPREWDLMGRGVSTCAVCDAAFFRDKIAYVVGGGDSSMEDALALTKFAREVHIVHRRDAFRASKVMQERVLSHEKITVEWNSTVSAIQDDGQKVTGITLQNTQTNAEENRSADGLFFAIGHVPNTEFLGDLVAKNAEGYITTTLGFDAASLELAKSHLNEHAALPYLTLTSRPGVFAAGDCVDFRYRQAVTAAAYGTMAALDVERWLESQA